jgi:hypothetical protein
MKRNQEPTSTEKRRSSQSDHPQLDANLRRPALSMRLFSSILIWSSLYKLLCQSSTSVLASLDNVPAYDAEHLDRHHAEPGFFANERVPSIPLIVKTPYLQAWLPVGSGEPRLAGKWCQFWTGQWQGWTGFVRVDGQSYTFMGHPMPYGQSIAQQLSYEVHEMTHRISVLCLMFLCSRSSRLPVPSLTSGQVLYDSMSPFFRQQT